MHQAAPGPTPRHTIAFARPGEAPVRTLPPPPPAEPDPVYDTLTDLFLGDGCMAPAKADARPTAVPPPQAAPAHEGTQIEALVLGHLPVLASAWVGQYAKHVAQAHAQPVALLRIRAGSVALDLVGSSTPAPSGREPLATLDAAIKEGAAETDRWVISVEATNEPRVAAMLGTGGIDTVTLLTGADEAAVVACYRTIKSLLGKAVAQDPDEPGPSNIQLGVMGAPADRAEEAGQKLSHAAETFLGQRPKVVACISKIGGAPSRPLYRGTDERTVEELVAIVRKMPLSRRAVSVPRPGVARSEPNRAPAPIPMPPESSASTVGRVGMPAPELSPPGIGERTSLAGHLPGLTPIPFRCPYVRRVEIAKSADGRVHLLAKVEHGNGLGSAAAHLAGASAWAKAHADLLVAACPGLSLDDEAKGPIAHVFTENAPDARSLLDSEIRVHVLAEARPGSGNALVCVDLN